MKVNQISNYFCCEGYQVLSAFVRIAAFVAGAVLAYFSFFLFADKNWLMGALFATGATAFLTFSLQWDLNPKKAEIEEEVVSETTRKAKLEVQKKTKVFKEYHSVKTPIFIAARRGEVSVIESYLLQNEFYEEDRRNAIPTLLQFAMKPNQDRAPFKRCIEKLIAAGCNIEALDDQGDSVLHVANRLNLIYPGAEEMIQFLLKCSAKSTKKNKYGETAAETLQLYQPKVIKEIPPPKSPTNVKEELTFYAKVQEKIERKITYRNQLMNYAEFLLLWLDEKISIRHLSLLHWAIVRGLDYTALELIKKSDSDIEERNSEGLTPLALALRSDRRVVVEALLAKGANKEVPRVHFYAHANGYQLT